MDYVVIVEVFYTFKNLFNDASHELLGREEIPTIFKDVCQVLELAQIIPIGVFWEVHKLQESLEITFTFLDG